MSVDSVTISTNELQGELFCGDTAVLKYYISYPQLSSIMYQPFIAALNRHYRGKAYSLKFYCEHGLYDSAVKMYSESVESGNPFRTFELNKEYKLTYNKDYTLSLYADTYHYEGGANGSVYRTSENWDIRNGCELPLCRLLNDSDCAAYIKGNIIKQISEQIKSVGNYFQDYENLVKENFDPKNFYVTENAVNVYFQEVTIAPHSSGIVVFLLPLAADGPRAPELAAADQRTGAQEPDKYRIRSELLMKAMDKLGFCTPEQAVSVWVDGLIERSAAVQYSVMSEKLKRYYVDTLEMNCPNWVTGVSSPWVSNYSVSEKSYLDNGCHLFKIELSTFTGAGFWNTVRAAVTVGLEDGFWRIQNIQGDKDLKIYIGDFSGD